MGRMSDCIAVIRGVSLPMVVAVALSSCATGAVTVQSKEKASGPKVVALDAPLEPWVAQIESRLRQRGFQVKHLPRGQTGQATIPGVRYVLRVGGEHYAGWGRRCIGGGYEFQSITAELIDQGTHEALATVSAEGYSEDCPPLSGTIFGDITNMVAERWE